MRNRWIYMSLRLKFYPITEKSYSNRSNLSVIGKETYQSQHEISSFWDFFSCLTWISQAINCILKLREIEINKLKFIINYLIFDL